MKKSVLLVFVVLSSFCSAQNVDSLLTVLKSSDSANKITIINTICEQTFYTQPQLCIDVSNDIDSLFKNMSDTSRFIHTKANIKLHAAMAFYFLGEFDKSYSNAILAEQRFTSLNDTLYMMKAANMVGSALVSQGMLEEAMNYYEQSITYATVLDDTLGLAKINNNIANIYLEMGLQDKAIETYENALENYESIKNEQLLATTYHNLGSVYGEAGENQKAIDYLYKTLKIANEIEDRYLIIACHSNIGDEFKNIGELDSAMVHVNIALDMAKQSGNKMLLAVNYETKGEILLKLAQYSKAIVSLDKSVDIANEINMRDALIHCYLALAETYEAMGDIKTAHEYLHKYIDVQNQVLNEETAHKIAQIQKRFDLKQSALKIQKLEQKQQLDKIELASEKKTRRILTMFLFGIAISFFVILILYRKLHSQHILLGQRNRELKQAMDEIKTLNTLLPICSHCKKIRDDEGYWQELETYFEKHTDSKFSHGICQSCMHELYPQVAERMNKNKSM